MGKSYNPVRGGKVIAYARTFLDQAAPLDGESHADAAGYSVENGKLSVSLTGGSSVGLVDEENFVGYTGDPESPQDLRSSTTEFISRFV